jgi:hypothetical protein
MLLCFLHRKVWICFEGVAAAKSSFSHRWIGRGFRAPTSWTALEHVAMMENAVQHRRDGRYVAE